VVKHNSAASRDEVLTQTFNNTNDQYLKTGSSDSTDPSQFHLQIIIIKEGQKSNVSDFGGGMYMVGA